MPMNVLSSAIIVIFFFSGLVLSNVTDRSIEDPAVDFKCQSGTVIPAKFVCDGEFDCGSGDGSDELNCGEHLQSSRDDASSEQVLEVDDFPKMGVDQETQKVQQEEASTDDSLHDDVYAIGKSWYKRFRRSTGTDAGSNLIGGAAMLDFLKVATYYLKLESINLESMHNLRRSEYTYPLVAFREKPPPSHR